MHKLIRRAAAVMALLTLAASFGTGCANPKILVSDNFQSERTAKYLLQPAGQSGGDDGEKLYHFYVRICNLNDDATESACQDTLILENVSDGSPDLK